MYYFKQVKDEKIIGIESKSVNVASPNFVKATKVEYDNFLASRPPKPPPEPPRDLVTEVDKLKVWAKTMGFTE